MKQLFNIANHRLVVEATANGCTVAIHNKQGCADKRLCSSDWLRLQAGGLNAIADYCDEWIKSGVEPR